MATGAEERRCVFPLTSLQIGDLQSYLSHRHLFLASESGSFYISVDNRPWLKDLASRSTHWWQLMVTKSRLSPFANTRGRKEKKMSEELTELQVSSSSGKLRSFRDWFSFFDAVLLSRESALLPVKKLKNSLIANSELHRTLYGFIVFEVSWSHIRGINYCNDLQTDTSLAVEAKVMRRWEFDSIAQASRSISTWFPGTLHERGLLRDHLDATLGDVYYDSQESFPSTTEANSNKTVTDEEDNYNVNTEITGSITNIQQIHPPRHGPYKRRKVERSVHGEPDLGFCYEEAEDEVDSKISDLSDCEELHEATLYSDVLILFRFNDPHLPFKLREIIMSRIWLLTLLEAGLPSWVIFLQSYPGFCRLYRPWMCPLARALYVLISVVTVLIGFYDLYKNVPLLKATVSKMFGPLFDWIDAWEMTSRIQYLGTMLFLHNFQKAMRWFLTATRTVLSFVSYFIAPIARELSELLDCVFPLWSLFIDMAEDSFSVIWTVMESSFTIIGDVLEMLLLPVWYIGVLVWNVATSFILPVLWVLLYGPFRLLFTFFSYVASSCTFAYGSVRDIWISARGIFQVTRSMESTVSTYEISMWRSLWNDLFSQVFRALRIVLNGLVAFFAACNRHRLSIYNHAGEFTRRSLRATRSAWGKENTPRGQTQESLSQTSKDDARVRQELRQQLMHRKTI
ncbi:hypothetical protein ACS0TY_030210 [Phlomoides rotata]